MRGENGPQRQPRARRLRRPPRSTGQPRRHQIQALRRRAETLAQQSTAAASSRHLHDQRPPMSSGCPEALVTAGSCAGSARRPAPKHRLAALPAGITAVTVARTRDSVPAVAGRSDREPAPLSTAVHRSRQRLAGPSCYRVIVPMNVSSPSSELPPSNVTTIQPWPRNPL